MAICAAPALALSDPAGPVSEVPLRADVETMVDFGTRHSVSSQTDPARGIGAAIDRALAEFSAIGAACGGCLATMAVASGAFYPLGTTD